MNEKIKCNACGNTNEMKFLFTNISDIGSRKVLLCPECGLEFLYPPLNDKEKSEIYDRDDYPGWGDSDDQFTSMKKNKFRRILNNLKNFNVKGKLLDVGCGPGYLLEVANEMGFDSYGVELSKNGSDLAKAKFGEDKIYNGTVETCRWYNTFDVITMNDLFEHIDDPVDTLNSVSKLLNSTNSNGGGYVIITTPDTGSITRKIMKGKWSHYKLEHVYYFNKKSIYEVAKKTGFEIIMYKPFWKILTISYLSHIFKKYPLRGVNEIFAVLEKIPIINNIQCPLLIGESIIILKKKN